MRALHRRSRGRVLAQADAVPVLREHGWVVIGVGDVDPQLGGASPGRVSAIQRSQQQTQARLALSIQCTAQHQLREPAAVLALLHLHCEEPVGLQLIALQRVTAHVRVLGNTHSKSGTRRCRLNDFVVDIFLKKARRVVVHVLDIHFHVENVQRVVHQHLEADRAGRRLAAHLLPVQPLVHVQVPVLLIHREVLLLLAQPQLARRQLVRAEPQVPRQRPHERASAQLLGDGVAEPLARRPAPHAQQQQQQRGQQRSPAARPAPLPHRHSLPTALAALLPTAAALPPFQPLSPPKTDTAQTHPARRAASRRLSLLLLLAVPLPLWPAPAERAACGGRTLRRRRRRRLQRRSAPDNSDTRRRRRDTAAAACPRSAGPRPGPHRSLLTSISYPKTRVEVQFGEFFNTRGKGNRGALFGSKTAEPGWGTCSGGVEDHADFVQGGTGEYR
ncbi:uncharacterized protein [Agelaius tricolor]|uniref:uncharacterized protein n=1 Tax=Agelaius tricolor TaxID=9191 RepID=UPI0039F16CC2